MALELTLFLSAVGASFERLTPNTAPRTQIFRRWPRSQFFRLSADISWASERLDSLAPFFTSNRPSASAAGRFLCNGALTPHSYLIADRMTSLCLFFLLEFKLSLSTSAWIRQFRGPASASMMPDALSGVIARTACGGLLCYATSSLTATLVTAVLEFSDGVFPPYSSGRPHAASRLLALRLRRSVGS
ncbi:hypothetical protein DFH08DRAFT_801981 [Mycena albidolilacea]|uniref:Secreted protein n=1 Tax=Mycena albidolilacea TaxID=1033008 RepID=A0AAD7F0I9_9AGAR|nr:hypothetical protein DFH08DRAFT_801981 [Mycena albidolilacea]